MAFNVLDPDAPSATDNAYISEAEFTAHHTDRNVDVSSYNSTQVQGAIVQATDFIDKRFGPRFRGYKQTRAQSLEWPRIDAYDNDTYSLDPRPVQLVRATAEYALLALQLGRNLAPVPVQPFSVINPDGTTTAGAGQVIGTRDKAGPLESEVRYSDTGSLLAFMAKVPEYPQADMWLKELIQSRRQLSRGS